MSAEQPCNHTYYHLKNGDICVHCRKTRQEIEGAEATVLDACLGKDPEVTIVQTQVQPTRQTVL